MERNKRKTYTGIVTSTKMDKTITVVVDTYKKAPLYRKLVKVSKKFHVHDEEQIANVGDKVRIMVTRPISKTKHFRLVNIITKAEVV